MEFNSCDIFPNNNNNNLVPEDLLSDIYLVKPKSKNIYESELLNELSIFANSKSEKMYISFK